jgi:hypothetical protein
MSKAHISKAEIALWGSVSWLLLFFLRHFNLHLRRLWFSIDRIEHIKKAQKAKSKVVKESKKKVKDTAHKVVDVVIPSSREEDRPVSWKKDVLEGRRKKIGNSKMEADGKANDQRTEAEQKRQSGNVYGQASEPATHDSQNEKEHEETPRPDLGIAMGLRIPEETIA